MGWAIIGGCAVAILYLWYQYDKKEREFQKWLNEVKRRSEKQSNGDE